MVVTQDITRFVEQIDRDPRRRGVILQDVTSGNTVAAQFIYCYDTDADVESVRQLFDGAFEELTQSQEGREFDEATLSIIKFLGRYKVTLVTKTLGGGVLLQDATASAVDRYMGLGS